MCGVEFKMGGRPAPGNSSAGDTHLTRGVEFMGAPISDRDFEKAFYEAKATAVHYKTNRRITSRIIRLELVVRTIGLVVRTIRLIVRTISFSWDPGG